MATYTLTATQLYGKGILNSFVITAASSVPTVSDPNAQAFLNAAVITDVTQANAVNALVIGLKADGLWTNMQALYPFVGGTATQHKYNLKDPRDLDAAYRIGFSGGWTHNSNGALGNAINTIADTSYVNFGDGEMGLYSRNTENYFGAGYPVNDTQLEKINYTPFKYVQGGGSSITSYFSDGDDSSGINGITVATTPTGLISLSGDSSISKLYKNGILIGSVSPSLPPSILYNNTIWLGGINISGQAYTSPFYSNTAISFGFITTTVLNGTQNTNLYNRIQTFQTALSRQV
jgi:hypothetical protein